MEGGGWVTSHHPTQRNRQKPYLVDNVLRGRRFREKFADGFRRLVRGGKLRLEEDWARLRDPKELEAWLNEVTAGSSATKTTASASGLGARTRAKGIGLASSNFQARSSSVADQPSVGARMHILPKGYTRSRCFGGYHGSKRQDYLNRCRKLLTIASSQPVEPQERDEDHEYIEPTPPKCPRCDIEMCCIEKQPRPSWKEVFERKIYADPAIYSPMHFCRYMGFPAFPHEPYG